MHRFFRPFLFSLFVCVSLLLFMPAQVNAGDPTEPKHITKISLSNPIGSDGGEETTDIPIILGRILERALTVIGSITFVVFIVGGAYWLVSAGNPERVKKGTQTMLWATIGLFVVFGAYGILSAVIGGLTGGAAGGGGGDSGDPSSPAIAAYHTIAEEDVWLLKDPKANSIKISDKVLSGVGCIASTGETSENGEYTKVIDPEKETNIGWVKTDLLQEPSGSCGTGNFSGNSTDNGDDST